MNEKLNWTDLRHQISRKSGVSEKDVNAFLNALIAQIKIGLSAEGTVRINGLGTFTRKAMAPRKSVNVATGEAITIPGYNKVSMTPAITKNKRKDIDPIGKIGEQAEEILGILAEVEGSDTSGTVPPCHEQSSATLSEGQSPAVSPDSLQEKEETQDSKKKKKKGISHPWLAAIITVLVFAAALAGVYLYLGYQFQTWVESMSEITKPKAETIQKAPAVPEVQEVPEVLDSIAEGQSPLMSTEEQAPVMPDLSETLKTERLNEGSRLRWMAKKAYGNPDLWVFIYEANKENIPDPDHIDVGTMLRVPKLSQEWLKQEDASIKAATDSLLKKYERH